MDFSEFSFLGMTIPTFILTLIIFAYLFWVKIFNKGKLKIEIKDENSIHQITEILNVLLFISSIIITYFIYTARVLFADHIFFLNRVEDLGTIFSISTSILCLIAIIIFLNFAKNKMKLNKKIKYYPDITNAGLAIYLAFIIYEIKYIKIINLIWWDIIIFLMLFGLHQFLKNAIDVLFNINTNTANRVVRRMILFLTVLLISTLLLPNLLRTEMSHSLDIEDEGTINIDRYHNDDYYLINDAECKYEIFEHKSIQELNKYIVLEYDPNFILEKSQLYLSNNKTKDEDRILSNFKDDIKNKEYLDKGIEEITLGFNKIILSINKNKFNYNNDIILKGEYKTIPSKIVSYEETEYIDCNGNHCSFSFIIKNEFKNKIKLENFELVDLRDEFHPKFNVLNCRYKNITINDSNYQTTLIPYSQKHTTINPDKLTEYKTPNFNITSLEENYNKYLDIEFYQYDEADFRVKKNKSKIIYMDFETKNDDWKTIYLDTKMYEPFNLEFTVNIIC